MNASVELLIEALSWPSVFGFIRDVIAEAFDASSASGIAG